MDSPKFKLYEKIASLEKKVVIIDIGYRYTKLGISGDTHPRCIIPTMIRDPVTNRMKSVLTYTKADELYDNLVEFLHYLYFKLILISPKDTKVIIVESLLSPMQLRATLAKVLFCHLQISSLLMLPSHMVALYTLAVSTGLVLDIGHEEACLIPVYEGYPVLHAYQAHPLAGRAVEANIRKLLAEYYIKADVTKAQLVENLSDKTIEDIKVRLCFVTTLERSQKLSNGEEITPPPTVDYNVAGTDIIKVEGSVRESACEVLFYLDGDEISLSTMILNSLLKCPIDMRKPLSESIVMMGGTSALPGIKSRILSELRHHLKSPNYKDKLFVDDFKMHNGPSHENYTAWLGGSLVGISEMVNMQSITKEEYKKEGDIPDWASLKYNLKQDDKTSGK